MTSPDMLSICALLLLSDPGTGADYLLLLSDPGSGADMFLLLSC